MRRTGRRPSGPYGWYRRRSRSLRPIRWRPRRWTRLGLPENRQCWTSHRLRPRSARSSSSTMPSSFRNLFSELELPLARRLLRWRIWIFGPRSSSAPCQAPGRYRYLGTPTVRTWHVLVAIEPSVAGTSCTRRIWLVQRRRQSSSMIMEEAMGEACRLPAARNDPWTCTQLLGFNALDTAASGE